MRTTRSVHLTDAGRSLLSRARPAVAELSAALEAARTAGAATKGKLRLTLPYLAYEMAIAGRLAAFQHRYPDIELELSFSEAFVDIAAEGFHAGLRLGDHIHDDMIAKPLTPPMLQAVFAAPDYLAHSGRPEQPSDLLRHNCIGYRYIASNRMAEWQFQTPDGIATVDVRGSLIVNSTNALLSAARAGIGLCWLFRPAIEADLQSGALVSVLDRFAIQRPGYFFYYPKAHARLRSLQIFMTFMTQRGDCAPSGDSC